MSIQFLNVFMLLKLNNRYVLISNSFSKLQLTEYRIFQMLYFCIELIKSKGK